MPMFYKHVAPLGLNELINQLRLIRNTDIFQPLHNLNRLQADRNHFSNKFDDVPRIVLTVRVVDDAAAFVCLDAILIYHPFQRRPIPKPIAKRFRGYSVKGSGNRCR